MSVSDHTDCWRCNIYLCKGRTHVLCQNVLSAPVKQSFIYMIKLRVYLRYFTEYFYFGFMAPFNSWSAHNISTISKTTVSYITYFYILFYFNNLIMEQRIMYIRWILLDRSDKSSSLYLHFLSVLYSVVRNKISWIKFNFTYPKIRCLSILPKSSLALWHIRKLTSC